MQPYQDLSGNAGVSAYEILEKAIILRFADEGSYLYDYEKPGKRHVEKMKLLAKAGKGLTTYVNQHIRKNYSRKLE